MPPTENQIKGKILEEVVKHYLTIQGYKLLIPNSNYGDMKILSNGLNVRGRGCYHQIDALGQFAFRIPFLYPIRLLSEAKYYPSRKIQLHHLRDFIGVIKDISKNYFIKNMRSLKELQRFTDCGAYFSISGFTKNAQMYAYGQGIFLVPCSFLKSLIDKIYDTHNNNISDAMRGMQNKPYCYYGIVKDLPLLIFSDAPLPTILFQNDDIIDVEIGYSYYVIRGKRTIKHFLIRIRDTNRQIIWVGKFELPKYIFAKHLNSKRFEKDMFDMKVNLLNEIHIPLIIERIKRMITLKLSEQFIQEIRETQNYRI